jgi:hypothetical protein
MLKKLISIFKFILFAPIRYERWTVFEGTKRRALEGSVVNQKDLAEFYFERNNLKEAFAWSYVASKNGNKNASILFNKYSELLTDTDKEEAEKLANYYYKNYSRPS